MISRERPGFLFGALPRGGEGMLGVEKVIYRP